MKINQLKAGVVLSYVSEAISVITGLLYTPIMLRLLGQSEYGLYQLSSSTISYLSLLSLGFGGAYVRYYSKYRVNNDTEGLARLNGMFMSIFVVIGIICGLAGTVLISNLNIIFGNGLSYNEMYTMRILMILMLFNLSISFPGSVFSSYITANEQYVFQRVVMILTHLCNPFLTLPLLLMGYKSIAVVVIQTILSFLTFSINLVFCKKKLGMSFDFHKFEWGLLQELFVFSFWIFLNQIIDQINWSVDKFILGVFGGATTVAIYGVASQINSLYISLSTSISSVFSPRVNKLVFDKEDDMVLTKLFTRVGRIQFMVLLLILSGLIIFGRYFILIWAGEGYEEAYQIVLLLAIPVTVPMIQNTGIEIQQAKNMHHYRSIIYMATSIVNVIVSIPLSQRFGGTGAAIGTAGSLVFGNGIIMNVLYHKKIGLDIVYFWKRIMSFIPAIIAPAAVGILIILFVDFSNIIVFAGWIVIYSCVYVVSMWLLGMNYDEKTLFKKTVQALTDRVARK